MAFLDNSGDIILDAVLTDLGRKRMAEGRFTISSFSVGDDEIDYSLFNGSHSSGSAYYDLEILQSPVMEAATKQASSIKYGLMSIERTDILFMPSMAINNKINEAVSKQGNMIYVAVNRPTYDSVKGLIGEGSVLDPTSRTPSKSIVIETGIESTERQATLENRNTMLSNTGLLDRNFQVKFDSRYISGIRSLVAGKFANLSDGTRDISLNQFRNQAPTGLTDFIDNYVTSFASTIPNLVKKSADGGTDGTNLSQITGPRGVVSSFLVTPSIEINSEGTTPPSYYSLYGKTNVTESTLFGTGGSAAFDHLDTTVYVVGTSSGAQLQVPVRLIRLRA